MLKNVLKLLFVSFTILTLTLLVPGTGYAQSTQSNYAGSSRFLDNWSVGLSGGVNTNLHTWAAPQGGHFGIEFGRKFTPIIGFRVQAGVGVNDLSNWQGHASHLHNGTVIDNVYTYLLGTFNLTNALFGYNGAPHVFEIVAAAGVGYGHGFNSVGNAQPNAVMFKDALLTKAGFDLDFNIGASKAWTISLRPSVVFNTAGHAQYCAAHAVFQTDAAVVYHFKNSNGKHCMGKAVLRDEAEIAMKDNLISQLNKENTDIKSENKALKKALTDELAKPVKVDTIKVNTRAVGTDDPYTMSIKFKQGSTKIINESDVAVLAEQIKAAGKKVNIFGYASTEGSEKFNNKLSEQRAMVVKQALAKYGIKNLLGKAIGMGATDKFSTDSLEANRVAVAVK